MEVVKLQRWIRKKQARKLRIRTDLQPIPSAFVYVCPRYREGARFCFRMGKKTHKWNWPWPEYLGVPTRSTINEWFDEMEEWRDNTLDIVDIHYLEECIRKMIRYL